MHITKMMRKALIEMWQDLARKDAYLLPIRLFIGTGWVRASLEKIITPGWLQGTALTDFLNQQLSGPYVVFPFYRRLISTLFVPNAIPLSWIILIGQMLVGLAVMFGILTNFALFWGVFMNLSFILAGQVSPSAFYIVIQTLLFVGNAGAIFGLDRFVSRRLPWSFISARLDKNRVYWRLDKVCFFLSSLIAFVIGLASIPFVRDYGPHSVEDPAMLMFVLSVVIGLTMLIKASHIRSAAIAYRAPEPKGFEYPIYAKIGGG